MAIKQTARVTSGAFAFMFVVIAGLGYVVFKYPDTLAAIGIHRPLAYQAQRAAEEAGSVLAAESLLGDQIVGNEVTNASNTTLTRSGAGSTSSPYTLGVNMVNPNVWTGIQTFSGGAKFPSNGTWDTNGKLGIGTNAGLGSLTIQGTSTRQASIVLVDHQNKFWTLVPSDIQSGDFSIYTNGLKPFYITNTGNVLLQGGGPNPADAVARLTVKGNIASSGSSGSVQTGLLSSERSWASWSFNFPVPFTSVPKVVLTQDNSGTGEFLISNLRIKRGSLTTTGMSIEFFIEDVITPGTVKINWMALQ